jgi:hypothetical protein
MRQRFRQPLSQLLLMQKLTPHRHASVGRQTLIREANPNRFVAFRRADLYTHHLLSAVAVRIL